MPKGLPSLWALALYLATQVYTNRMADTLLAQRYRLGQCLGQGGMGTVYAAFDTVLHREVALKVVRPEAAAATLLAEARAAARLNHPNIITIYDIGQTADDYFIVMELLAGGTLRQRLPLGLPTWLALARQVTQALHHAHTLGLIHRDIKPENILCQPGDPLTIKLTDFGLANFTEADPDAVTGTVAYLAPELITGQPATPLTDAYALGAVLYEALTGHPPFEAPDVGAVLAGHLYTTPTLPSLLAPQCPPWLDELLLSLLAKEPNRRPRALAEVLRALGDALAEDTPAPAQPGNLPTELSPLVGREADGVLVLTHLRTARLVSLVGPGGVGKTRLALHVARATQHDYPHGVWWVELAALTQPQLVPRTVARLLGLPNPHTPAALATALRPRQALLVLDNCEHLLVACADLVAGLLRHCPALTVMTTSREALGVEGEVVLSVPPLTVPEPTHDWATIAHADAVRLLVARTQAVNPRFALTPENAAALAEICRRLDGLPLALELAAARLRTLSPTDLAARLHDVFRALPTGPRHLQLRQQTLWALVAWSYDLLPVHEQTAFAQLAVCTGLWDVAAAQAVTRLDDLDMLDVLSSLVNKSLLVVEQVQGETYYRWLETLRQFASQQAAANEAVPARHAAHFLAVAERADPLLRGPYQREWFDRLTLAHDNLRAASAWALRHQPELALRLVNALAWFGYVRGHWREMLSLLVRALAVAPAAPSRARAQAHANHALLLWALDEHPTALTEATLSAQMFAALADDTGHAFATFLQGWVLAAQNQFEVASTHYAHSLALFRRLGNLWGVAWVTYAQGRLARKTGASLPIARQCYEESLQAARQCGDRRSVYLALYELGSLDVREASLPAAQQAFVEVLTLANTLGDKSLRAMTLEQLGYVYWAQLDFVASRQAYAASLATWQDLGNAPQSLRALFSLGVNARCLGQTDQAEAHYRAALTLARDLRAPAVHSDALEELGDLALSRGDLPTAYAHLKEALALRQTLHDQYRLAYGLFPWGGWLALAGQTMLAAQLMAAGQAALHAQGQTTLLPAETADFNRLLAPAQSRLSPEDFQTAWHTGQTLSLAEALALLNRALPSDKPSPV